MRSDTSKTVSRDEVASLYKLASSGMTKKALELNDDAKAALIGALGGAGVGLVSHAVTPKDKDEDQTSRLLSHVLAGAAMGGLSGYGLKRLHSRVADATKKEDPGWYQRNAPELSYSRAATLGGLGAGAYAGAKGVDILRGTSGASAMAGTAPGSDAIVAMRRFLGSSASDISKSPELTEIARSYGAANASLKNRLLSKLHFKTLGIGDRIPKWLGGDAIRRAATTQVGLDEDLFRKLVQLSSKNRAPYAAGALDAAAKASSTARLANARKIMNSMRRGGGGKKALYAALVSALLLGGGAAIRSQNKD